MRGSDDLQEGLFSFSTLESFIPKDHPLRANRERVNKSLKGLNDLCNEIYADTGRQSIAPERLIRALLLQVFYSIRSERQRMEQMRDNMQFRCFAGSWAWRSTMRCGTTRCSPRTGIGCWSTR